MAEKKEKDDNVAPDRAVKELFSAQLEMTTIHPKVVRYRVTGHKGLAVLGLHHIELDRANFPKHDDFNMGFINMTLPKGSTKGDFAKQAAFKKFKKLSIEILTV